MDKQVLAVLLPVQPKEEHISLTMMEINLTKKEDFSEVTEELP